jgi:hypothetical protein
MKRVAELDVSLDDLYMIFVALDARADQFPEKHGYGEQARQLGFQILGLWQYWIDRTNPETADKFTLRVRRL